MAKYDNERFAETVWGRDDKGRTWQLMYFLTEPVEVDRYLSEYGDSSKKLKQRGLRSFLIQEILLRR